MAKEQKSEPKANKTHKTLRDKLRKRREELKRHKKEKSEKKKQYNPSEEKLNFFNKGQSKSSGDKTVKLKRVKKQIEKFINLYEDDIEQFYDLFNTLDCGGGIDISGLENRQLYKCLKKLFKYLPMKKQNGQYKKITDTTMNMSNFMKEKVSQAIQHYLQYGSQNQESEQDSSGDEKQKNKKEKKQKKGPKMLDEQQGHMGPIRLYKDIAPQAEAPQTQVQKNIAMGPCLPEAERQKLAQMFDKQLQQLKREKQAAPQRQDDEFDQIFSMYQTRGQMRAAAKPAVNNEVPEHLMAAGSARIGQKADIDQAQIEEYNKMHRPKSLLEIHKELMGSKGIEESTKKRRYKDDGKNKDGGMTNSTFFDFRSKMSKPKSTNQFL